MYENGTTTSCPTDGSAGWLLPWLLFGANGRGWGQGNGCNTGGCGCGPTLASELGKAGNEALRDQISQLSATIASDKSASQSSAVIAAISAAENQITNILNAGQLSDCAKQAELIRAIDTCCCETQRALCEVKTTVLMGNQNLSTQAATNALQMQHAVDTGFCAVNENINRSSTALGVQLCQAVTAITATVRDENDKTRGMLHAAEVTELRDKLAASDNAAQTAKLEALINCRLGCGCGCGGHHDGCGGHHGNGNGNGQS